MLRCVDVTLHSTSFTILGKIPPNADLVFDVELVSINGKTRSDLEKFEAELNKWAAKTLSSCEGMFGRFWEFARPLSRWHGGCLPQPCHCADEGSWLSSTATTSSRRSTRPKTIMLNI